MISFQAITAKQLISKELKILIHSSHGGFESAFHKVNQSIQENSKIHSEEGDELDKLNDIFIEMLFAGYKTSASAMTSIVLHLTKNPRVKHKLVHELRESGLLGDHTEQCITYRKLQSCSYLRYVIKEVLRLCPPVGGGFRKTLKTIEIGVSLYFIYSLSKYYTHSWHIVLHNYLFISVSVYK